MEGLPWGCHTAKPPPYDNCQEVKQNMDYPRLRLSILPEVFAVCSLPPEGTIPDFSQIPSIISITRTPKELTIVCDENHVPEHCNKSGNFKCIKVEGCFDLNAVGVLASIAEPLAQSKISIYVLSTYETDYILIHAEDIDTAVSCLTEFGHTFVETIDES